MIPCTTFFAAKFRQRSLNFSHYCHTCLGSKNWMLLQAETKYKNDKRLDVCPFDILLTK